MALIEKIRNQGWLVLVMVGIGIIGYLIPYDAVMAMFGRGSDNLGEVDGHVITQKEWTDAVNTQKLLYNYNGNESALSNDTWNTLTERLLMNDEYQALGLTVTDDEYDMITFGEMLSPFVKSTIYQGQDSASIKERMRQNFDGMEPERSASWKQMIQMKRQKEKFDLMVKKGMYANNLDGKWAFKQSNDKVNVDYVLKTYQEIPDSVVTVNESDIRAYYNKHKKDREYKQKETTRSLEYIRFPVTPSDRDTAVVRDGLTNLIEAFRSSTTDSLFAVLNASNPMSARSAYQPGSLAEPMNTQILSDSVGKVIGPYWDGMNFKISKISKRSMEVDSVQARHILFKEKGPQGRAKADSVKAVIEKNNNFAEMAALYGTDGTKDKGGDLGMFTRGAMVKPFENACFNGAVGKLQVIDTDFGTHIVEVTKKNPAKLVTTIYTIDKPVTPSAATVKGAFTLASEFSMNFSDTASFRNAADTLRGGTPITPANNVKVNDQNIPGLANAGAVVQWAYSAKTGEVSQPMKVDDSYIIAALVDIKERGIPSFENVKDKMREETIKEKKAEKYMEMMKTGTLEEIATNVGSSVRKADNLTLRNSNIPGSGVSTQEPEVLGVCFGINNGFTTAPIKGKGGVYVIRRTSELTEGQSQDNFLTDRTQLANTLQARAAMSVFNSMKEEGNVEDNRYERR